MVDGYPRVAAHLEGVGTRVLSSKGLTLVWRRPGACTHTQETRTPLPPRPGAARAYDYEYQRNGVSSVRASGLPPFLAGMENPRRPEMESQIRRVRM